MAQPLEQKSPPAFDIKSPLDISKWNAAGDEVPAISDAKQQALDAQEQLFKSLEARYASPNYFKVGAAFLKPQLGGFGASLGSAAEAMGENVEAQRAIAPTIERMKAEVQQGRIGMESSKEQARRIKQYDENKMNNPAELRAILALNRDSDIGKSIIDRLALETGRREETGFNVGLQQKVLESPSLIIDDPVYKGLNATPEQAAEYQRKVNAARPDGYTAQEWAAMTVPAKEDAIAQYASAKAKQGMSEGSKFALESGNAHNILDELAPMRQLAMDPKLEPVFALFRDGDLFSQIRAFAAENPGLASGVVEGFTAAKLQRLTNIDRDTRTKADKLIKDIAALEVRLRGSLNNPTDAATVLSSQRSPTLANSRDGFVGILDQLALGANRDIGVAKLHNKLVNDGITAKDAAYNEAMENYRNETRRVRREVASGGYDLNKMPTWYDTRNQNAKPAEATAEKPTTAKPNAPTAAPTTSSSRPNERTIGGKTYVRKGNNWEEKGGSE
jgi:hypothetical protein